MIMKDIRTTLVLERAEELWPSCMPDTQTLRFVLVTQEADLPDGGANDPMASWVRDASGLHRIELSEWQKHRRAAARSRRALLPFIGLTFRLLDDDPDCVYVGEVFGSRSGFGACYRVDHSSGNPSLELDESKGRWIS